MELSIIIPTLNRASSLRKTLQSILEQNDVVRPYEVIVVDNGSTDETEKVCRSFKGLINNFLYTYDDEPGQLTGRHRGLMLSSGDIVSFLDDDVELNPNWINSVLHLFQSNHSVSIIGGPCLPKYQLYPPSWVSYFWEPNPYGGNMCLPLSLIDIGRELVQIDPVYVFGLNYSIKKNVLLELGGFHPDCIPQHLQKYQGDGETGLSLNARRQNIKALYSASTFLYHHISVDRLTPGYFEKWYYYNGVCQSYTDIRLKYKPYPENTTSTFSTGSLMSRAVNKTVGLVKTAVGKNKKNLPANIIKLQTCFLDKFNEGYKFHQNAFETDVAVKNWVLKDDYWNYKLPL